MLTLINLSPLTSLPINIIPHEARTQQQLLTAHPTSCNQHSLEHANQPWHQLYHKNPLNSGHFTALIYLTTLTTSLSTASQNALILLANSVSVDMKSGAATKITMARVWLVMLVSSVGLLGIAAGQACTRTFFSAVVQLMPCRPAVASLSPAPPSEACCNAVRTLGQPCLCALADGPPITGVDPNMTMQLPGKCTVNFAPCNSRV